MNLKTSPVIAVCAVLLLPALVAAGPEAMPLLQGGELLRNPGMDGPMWFKSQCCGEDGLPINEVQIADGWMAWWAPTPPPYIVPPDNCEHRALWGCYWMRPEFVDSARTLQPSRIHGGNNSQKYFSFGRMHEAGIYQRVAGITPGARLHFSVFIEAWMCIDPADCDAGHRSDNPTTMHMRVGIDPYGGTNAYSPDIVWSGEVDSFDHWTQYSVEAVAQSDAVAVFTHSRPEWTAVRLHNDVYVDDASLVQVGVGPVVPRQASQPAATPTVPAPTAPAAAAMPTSATVAPKGPTMTPPPRPAGAVVHVVQAGDTLSAIAAQYNVPLEDLYKLNNLTNESIIEVGQQIVVKVEQVPTAPPAPTAAPTQPPAAAPTLPPPPTATPVQGGLCLSAFEDTNNNSLRDGNEAGLAGVTFVVLSGGVEAARHTTDDSLQPNCLTKLAPGAYSVQVTPPAGYVAALEKTDVTLAAGLRTDLVVAARRGAKATATAPAQSAGASASAGPNTSLIVGVVIVVLVLVLIGVVVMVVQRRQ